MIYLLTCLTKWVLVIASHHSPLTTTSCSVLDSRIRDACYLVVRLLFRVLVLFPGHHIGSTCFPVTSLVIRHDRRRSSHTIMRCAGRLSAHKRSRRSRRGVACCAALLRCCCRSGRYSRRHRGHRAGLRARAAGRSTAAPRPGCRHSGRRVSSQRRGRAVLMAARRRRIAPRCGGSRVVLCAGAVLPGPGRGKSMPSRAGMADAASWYVNSGRAG